MKVISSSHVMAVFFLLSLVAVVSGCASNKPLSDTELDEFGNPKWVTQGSSTVKTTAGRFFHGVGFAQTSGNFSRQTSIADGRARAELENVISSYIEIVSRDFIASESTLLSSTNHLDIMRNIENMTEQNMRGVRVVAHWMDDKSKRVYSFAQIDMGHIKHVLKKAVKSDPAFMKYFEAQGEKIFDRISSRDF